MTLNKSLNIALPKGRILDSVLPILKKVGIEPEKSFFDTNDRKLKFNTNINNIEFINFKPKISCYNLLAITCNEKKIILNFSMSAKIKLDCKEINATIEDIDIPWPTKIKPQHD